MSRGKNRSADKTTKQKEKRGLLVIRLNFLNVGWDMLERKNLIPREAKKKVRMNQKEDPQRAVVLLGGENTKGIRHFVREGVSAGRSGIKRVEKRRCHPPNPQKTGGFPSSRRRI